MIVGYTIARGYTLLHQAQGIILTRIVRTDEDLLLAVDARISHGTGAGIGRQLVHADASILAGRRGALVNLLWQIRPCQPAGQSQVNSSPGPSMHSPPCWQRAPVPRKHMICRDMQN